jgi:3-hydroxy-9,10-secoandrosta-1,3,5(10)-triene-9,17-dione monooxygenase reductase component
VTAPPEPARVDQADYRRVLGHFPTGVTVIAAVDGDEAVGVAVGSFFSVSLDPPTVGFCAARASSTWPRIASAGVFCVNILGAAQEDICRRFANKDADRFRSIGWSLTAGGSPRLDGVLAWIDCGIEQVVESGDHYIVVGRVRDLAVEHEGGPLVFYRGGFGGFAP